MISTQSLSNIKKLILIGVKIENIMPLFCKQCNDRRLPIFQYSEKITIWLCEKCENFVDPNDIIIREITESEKNGIKAKLEKFRNEIISLPAEKMSRRKGVN